jgi:sugar phosphate isomerase/epimerase
MNLTFSIFPKFYQHLSVPELAALVREVGLDTSNAVIRDGFWVSESSLAAELPRFVAQMQDEGLQVRFATTGYTASKLIADPKPLEIMAENGIAEFRMGYFKENASGTRESLKQARGELETLSMLCEQAGMRAVYQVHHGTLIPGPSAAWQIVEGLPAEWIGVELDPGNQTFEGYEEWGRSCRLLNEYLVAIGIKDSTVYRDPKRANMPDKGWTRRWCGLHEGVTNWRSLLTALNGIGFEGTFVFMPFYHEHEPELRTRTLKEEVAYLRAEAWAVTENVA